MKFSVITATYNSAATIGDTIRSIAEQDYPREKIEWIVVDGCSTDHTLQVIKDSEFQPDRLLSEKDEGIYDALNKGVRMASGDVVGFLHADDILAGSTVLTRISCAFRNSGAQAVYGDLQYVKPSGAGKFAVIRHWKSGIYHQRNIKWGWMPPHPTFYLKREIYGQAVLDNGEYFDTSFRCAADYDFMMRILSRCQGEPTYLRMVLVKMRVGGISNRSFGHIVRKSKEDWRVIQRNGIGGMNTLAWKNLRKVSQFIARRPVA